jgi:hypothetical protein
MGSTDPNAMVFRVVRPLKSSRRRMDLFCLACARLVLPLMEDDGAKRAFEWLEAHVGQRPHSGHPQTRFQGPAQALDDARKRIGSGSAVHVAWDLWIDEYEYAFPNLCGLMERRTAEPRDPRPYLSETIRDIFGNPFRPVAFDPVWRTDTALALARQMYESRDFSAMPILADALQDAGCACADILDHCRGPGPHVRGCWVVDLVSATQEHRAEPHAAPDPAT